MKGIERDVVSCLYEIVCALLFSLTADIKEIPYDRHYGR